MQSYFDLKVRFCNCQKQLKTWKIHWGPWVVEVTLTLGCLCPSGLILFFAVGVDIIVIQLDGGDERQRMA